MSTMIEVGPEHVVEVLHALGATMVAEKRSEADILVGYEVSPPIDLSGYQAELAAFRKIALVAHLKARRWQAETAGITATIGGEPVRISTARGDDRAALHQVYSAMSAGLRSDGAVFNFADGVSRSVSNAEMTAAVLAALAHVQACFDLEGELRTSIEAGTVSTKEDIDAAEWPAT